MSANLLKMEDQSYELTINQNKYHIAAADIINPLGKGAFGIVYKAIYNNATYAIKQLNKSGNDINKVKQEIQIMESLKGCYNIVQIIDNGEDTHFIYIVMTYCDLGNLTQIINKGLLKDELEIIELFRQICYGIFLLHQKGLIHRDLKTDNILVQSYNDSKYPYKYYMMLADFGLARETLTTFAYMTMNVGTEYTKAPEVCTGLYDKKADVYSLGCILYQMLTKKTLFGGGTVAAIQEEKKKTYFKMGACYSQFTMNLLEGCLQYDKNKRMLPKELANILQLETLYTDYKPLSLGNVDTDQVIYMRERKRMQSEQMKNAEELKAQNENKLKEAQSMIKEELKAMYHKEIKEEIQALEKKFRDLLTETIETHLIKTAKIQAENQKCHESIAKLQEEKSNFVSLLAQVNENAKMQKEAIAKSNQACIDQCSMVANASSKDIHTIQALTNKLNIECQAQLQNITNIEKSLNEKIESLAKSTQTNDHSLNDKLVAESSHAMDAIKQLKDELSLKVEAAQNYAQSFIEKLDIPNNIKNQEETFKIMQSSIDTISKQLEVNKIELKAITSDIAEVQEKSKQNIDIVNAEIWRLKNALKEKSEKAELTKLTESVSNMENVTNGKIEKLTSNLKDQMSQLKNAVQSYAQATQENKSLKDDITNDINTKHQILMEQVKNLNTAVERKLDEANSSLNTLCNELKNQIQSNSDKQCLLQATVSELNNQLKQAMLDYKSLNESQRQSNEAFKDEVSSLDSKFKNACNNLESNIDSLKATFNKQEKDIEIKFAASEYNAKINKLEEIEKTHEKEFQDIYQLSRTMKQDIEKLQRAYEKSDKLNVVHQADLINQSTNASNTENSENKSVQSNIQKLEMNFNKRFTELSVLLMQFNNKFAVSIQKSLDQIRQQIQQNDDALAKLSIAHESINRSLQEIKSKGTLNDASIEQLNATLKAQSSQINALNASKIDGEFVSNVKNELKKQSDAISASTKGLEKYEKGINELKGIINTSNAKAGSIESSLTYLKKDLETIKKEIENHQNLLNDKVGELRFVKLERSCALMQKTVPNNEKN